MNTTNSNATKIVLASDLVEGKYYKLANFEKVFASPHSQRGRNILKTNEVKLFHKRKTPVGSDLLELFLLAESPQGTEQLSMLVKQDQEFIEKKPAAGFKMNAAGQNGGRKSRKNMRKNRRMTRNKRR